MSDELKPTLTSNDLDVIFEFLNQRSIQEDDDIHPVFEKITNLDSNVDLVAIPDDHRVISVRLLEEIERILTDCDGVYRGVVVNEINNILKDQ